MNKAPDLTESLWKKSHNDRLVLPRSTDHSKGCPGGSVVKNPLPMQETRVQSLSQEEPLGEGNDNPLQYS